MSTQAFPYRPLSEPDSFRILHLQPSPDRTAQIICKLKHTTLDQYDYDILSPYTALSYVWGDLSDPRVIQLDGQPFAVTRNLHDALECLRDDERICTIWADAICIDQLNIPERNAQVEQMGRIYSCATHTVIFLDPSSQDLEIVLQGMKDIKRLDENFHVERNDIVHDSFERIVSRPWFNRVWILQELVLSKDPFVQCGRVRVRWDAFCGFETALQQDKSLSGNETAIASRFSALTGMFKVRSRHVCGALSQIPPPALRTAEGETEVGNTLVDLVISRRGYGATDPRDIVYAQMGIASDHLASRGVVAQDIRSISHMPRVDYSKSVAHVYAEMTYYMLLQNKYTFSFLERTNSMQHQHGLPSWVPDWSKPWHALLGKPKFKNRSTWADQRPPILLSRGVLQGNKHILISKAILGAEIVQMGATVGVISDLPETLKTTTEYFQPDTQELSSDQLNQLIEGEYLHVVDWRSDTDKSHLIEHGFQKMLHAWASAIGLPDATLLPLDEVPSIAECFYGGFYKDLWRSKSLLHRPFLLMAIYHEFTFWNGRIALSYRDHPPLFPTNRFCTVRRTWASSEVPYQIIAVPEIAQVGDVLAKMQFSHRDNWVVLRSMKIPELWGKEEFPPTYEVVGTCHPKVDINRTAGLELRNRCINTIALV